MTGYNDKDGNILVDEKGLYIYPGFGPFIAHEALDCMEKFVLLHQCDKSLSIPFLNKNPEMLKEFLAFVDYIKDNNPRYNKKGTMKGGPWILLPVAESTVSTLQKNNFTFPESVWNTGVAMDIFEKSPHISTILKRISDHLRRKGLFDLRSGLKLSAFGKSLQLRENIQSGKWTVTSYETLKEKNNPRKGEGFVVFVTGYGYISEPGKYSTNLAEARIYDSLEAAKRSAKGRGHATCDGRYENVAFMSITLNVQEILERKGKADPSVQRMDIEMTRDTLMEGIPVHETTENKKPHKM